MKKYLLILPILALILASCQTPKQMLYFPNLANEGDIVQVIPDSIKNYESRIVPDDMLTISVSALDPNAVVIFNLPTTNFIMPGENTISTTPSLHTYLVDKEGYIEFPIIGKVKLGGLTLSQASERLKEEIKNYVEDPLVSIQCINYKITILGEVGQPGSYPIESERVTILDALGKAKDMTIYGNHTNVLLIREENGVRSFHRLDLSQPDIFTSPYYYLQRNDVIYVEPNEARQGYAGYSQDKQYMVSVVSAVTSAVSVIVSLCIALFVK